MDPISTLLQDLSIGSTDGTSASPSAASTVFSLVLACVVGAAFAYHPTAKRRIRTRAELELPKAMIVYALVGALVGHLVVLEPSVALVVFGIGGLLRFRTLAGDAKDTGRMILVTILGICVGLQSFVVGLGAAALAYLLLFFLERTRSGEVQILGVPQEQMNHASKAYRTLLEQRGCNVVGESRNSKKQSLELMFQVPTKVSLPELENDAGDIEPSHRGFPHWELG